MKKIAAALIVISILAGCATKPVAAPAEANFRVIERTLANTGRVIE